jgi:hypothetical protein
MLSGTWVFSFCSSISLYLNYCQVVKKNGNRDNLGKMPLDMQEILERLHRMVCKWKKMAKHGFLVLWKALNPIKENAGLSCRWECRDLVQLLLLLPVLHTNDNWITEAVDVGKELLRDQSCSVCLYRWVEAGRELTLTGRL